ncbi:MAG: SWIM zinc finger family protein [Candidatus Bathyarchaeota archaeon]|nr:MAG: SWIM zinc finger family protein [Candidatus Bathyarchaeota archaeon]
MVETDEIIEETNAIVAEGKIFVNREEEIYTVEDPSKKQFEVAQTIDGWYCSCEPYKDKGICQHILAVNIAAREGTINEQRAPRPRGRPRRRSEQRRPRRRPSGQSSERGRRWGKTSGRRTRSQNQRRR